MVATTIEQSKRLIELGIDPNTADLLYSYDCLVDDCTELNVITPFYQLEDRDIPAWSLSALLELLPGYELRKRADGRCELDCHYCLESEGEETPVDIAVDLIEMLCKNAESKTYLKGVLKETETGWPEEEYL